MRILFLTPRLPFPPNRGDRLRSFHYGRVLSKKHSLSLLSLIQSDKEMQYVEDLKGIFDNVEVVLLKPWRSYLNMVLHFFSKMTLQVSYFYSKQMNKKVKEILKREKFDVIYTFSHCMAPYASEVKGAYKIFDLTDAISLFLRRMVRHRNIFLRPLLYWEYLKTKRYEPYIIKKFDECWFISPVDRDAISIPGNTSNIVLVPNGIDVDYFKPEKSKRNTNTILFVGYMGIESVITVLHFYKEIFPLVKKEIPSAKFYVVGADPPKKITKLASNENVVVTGFVEDLRLYYNEASVLAAPMRFVAGVQNKILEAMAMEVPVVTSRLGNEGIDANVGKEIFVEDEPKAFANCVVKLLKNEDLRKQVGANARRFVQKNFTWEKVVDRLDEIYLKISERQEDIF